jgi:glucokinase
MAGCRGCLAAYLSGEWMARRGREALARHPDSALLALAGGNPAAITAALVFRAAASGDTLAGAMVSEACEALAAGLGGIVNGLNPEILIVTGGVAESLVPLREDILRRATAYALPDVLEQTVVHFVAADKQRTALGGAALVLYELARRPAFDGRGRVEP